MNKINRKPRNEMMYKAILSLQSVEECEQFFDDLCTVTELQALEQRFQVAWLLNKGMIYNDILQETGASSATISRVKRSLQYGRDGTRPYLRGWKKKKTTEGILPLSEFFY